ncbi:hypothetical protein [Pseudochelatococcus contaminans]|uniref:Uncharacterized protein n=1 Tax=Pseudochelatococcus contaminans TaxID=1538103 RepID=A0A7W5Z7S8_9HYPH|nr:hypothetical protein [Pseudochelatococcus contaminans]MBB3811066.1 hypothetical protein [Pseudochelatococcus contaminans]
MGGKQADSEKPIAGNGMSTARKENRKNRQKNFMRALTVETSLAYITPTPALRRTSSEFLGEW